MSVPWNIYSGTNDIWYDNLPRTAAAAPQGRHSTPHHARVSLAGVFMTNSVKVYKYKLIFSGWWECGSDLWLRACRGGGLQCQMVQRGSGDIQVMLKLDIFQITNCFTGVNLDLFPAPLPLSRCFPYLVSELTSPGLMKESSPWKRSQCSHLDTICAR